MKFALDTPRALMSRIWGVGSRSRNGTVTPTLSAAIRKPARRSVAAGVPRAAKRAYAAPPRKSPVR